MQMSAKSETDLGIADERQARGDYFERSKSSSSRSSFLSMPSTRRSNSPMRRSKRRWPAAFLDRLVRGSSAARFHYFGGPLFQLCRALFKRLAHSF
jgi:hypothetical protein